MDQIPGRPTTALDTARLAAIRRAYERGIPASEVARIYGVHRSTIAGYAAKEGWGLPRPRALAQHLAASALLARERTGTGRSDAKSRARSLDEWSLVRRLLRLAIDHQDANRAALARSCAETLMLIQQAEQDLQGRPTVRLAPRHQGGRSRQGSHMPRRVGLTPTIDHVGFEDLYRLWAANRPHVCDRTRRQWRATLLRFQGFIGHDEPAAVTREDALRWKMHMLGLGLGMATLRCLYVAAPRAMFEAGLSHGLITVNPFQRLGLAQRPKPRLRSKSFSEEEARTVLEAALAQREPSGRESRETVDLRRWSPWLCAFTGARIGEICQLRAEDVIERDGCWVLHLTPAAGRIKTDEPRLVPLHPQLLDQGFLDFVRSRPKGPLFAADPASAGRDRTKKVSSWVRAIGVSDPQVQPCHAWRHRFKTRCRQAGIPLEYHDALTGHCNRRSASGSYGEFPVSALYREICKLPRIRLTTTSRAAPPRP